MEGGASSTLPPPSSSSTGLKTPMPELNAKMALLRLRLYRTLASLPSASFESRSLCDVAVQPCQLLPLPTPCVAQAV